MIYFLDFNIMAGKLDDSVFKKNINTLVFLILAAIILTGCQKNAPTKPTDVKGTSDSVEEEQINNNSQENDMLQKQNNTTTSYESAPAMTIDQNKTYIATLKTNKGDIKIQLDTQNTPITTNNFVFLANDDFYDGVIFHRVIKNFMAQGGDPTGSGMGGPGYKFEDEITETNQNLRGTIAMANAGPNTNGSQFFINVVDNNYLDARHTVFGKVVEGMEVVDEITNADTDATDKPLEDIVINDVVIEEK